MPTEKEIEAVARMLCKELEYKDPDSNFDSDGWLTWLAFYKPVARFSLEAAEKVRAEEGLKHPVLEDLTKKELIRGFESALQREEKLREALKEIQQFRAEVREGERGFSETIEIIGEIAYEALQQED